MIDKRLYQETFSHLRASDQAKQEVFQKMQEMKHRKRMPRVLRGAAIAAAMVMALAVTRRGSERGHGRGVLPAVHHRLDIRKSVPSPG